MTDVECLAELVSLGVLGAWEVHGLKNYVVFDAPVPEVYGLGAEGERLGTALLVDIHDCCDVVGKELNVEGLDK